MGAKAFVGAGSIPLSDAVVKVAMWLIQVAPPTEIMACIQIIAASLFAYIAVWFVPDNR